MRGSGMSFTERLKELFRQRSTPQRKLAHADVVQRLYQAELAKRALQPGDRAPAFLLPNAEGTLVASVDLLACGPLVISFFRGGWCPYCALTMREMEATLPAIAAAGGRFVAIWPETGGLARRTKRDRGLHLELLIDVDNALAMQFGLVFRTPELYRQLLLDQGVDLSERHGNTAWLLPVPATYVVAPDGIIAYAFADGDFTSRADPETIVRAVAALAGR